MNVIKHQSDFSRTAKFVPDFRDSELVPVYQFTNIRGTEWEPADINWAAIGDATPEEAKQFAECVLAAAKLAREWTENPPASPS